MGTLDQIAFTAYVGIDWADKKHDACIQQANSKQREFVVIPHNVKLIDEWAKSLCKQFGSPIAVGVFQVSCRLKLHFMPPCFCLFQG